MKNYKITLASSKPENLRTWIEKLKLIFHSVTTEKISDNILDVNFQSDYSNEKNYNLLSKIYPTTIFKN